MRIYKNTEEANNEILRDLVEMGIEYDGKRVQDKNINMKCKELFAYQYSILSPFGIEDLLKKKGTYNWAMEEFQERISPYATNPGEAFKLRNEIWDQYLIRNNQHFSYTYNERIRTQISRVIDILDKDHNTRQGVISVYNPTIDSEKIGIDRIPCTMYYQFLYREGKLITVYNQRSCDFLKHWLEDIYLAFRLGEYIGKHTSLEPGEVIHNVGSLHVFEDEYKKLGVF